MNHTEPYDNQLLSEAQLYRIPEGAPRLFQFVENAVLAVRGDRIHGEEKLPSGVRTRVGAISSGGGTGWEPTSDK